MQSVIIRRKCVSAQCSGYMTSMRDLVDKSPLSFLQRLPLGIYHMMIAMFCECYIGVNRRLERRYVGSGVA